MRPSGSPRRWRCRRWTPPTGKTRSPTGLTRTISPAGGTWPRLSWPPGSTGRGSIPARGGGAGATREGGLRWLNYTAETELLMNEIEDSTTRISTLVGAAKQYSQLDRAPYQVVDVHELLDSTLLMLGGKIPSGIHVVKDYDRSLPHIPAYAGELNQVWTNLIDNAVSAMKDSGPLTVRTELDGDQVWVEFGDTGPGVPADIQRRIFEPFFTTKPVGEGTGLGLDISWRIVVNKHHGDLSLESTPGDTRFRVRLPVTAPESAPVAVPDGPDAVHDAALGPLSAAAGGGAGLPN